MEKIGGIKDVGLYKNKTKKGYTFYFTLKINKKTKWFKAGTSENGYRVDDLKKDRTKKYNEINHLEKKMLLLWEEKKVVF